MKFSEPIYFDRGTCAGIAITLPDGRRHACRADFLQPPYRPLRDDELEYMKQMLLDWAARQPPPQ